VHCHFFCHDTYHDTCISKQCDSQYVFAYFEEMQCLLRFLCCDVIHIMLLTFRLNIYIKIWSFDHSIIMNMI
jgi:hypothetical protein